MNASVAPVREGTARRVPFSSGPMRIAAFVLLAGIGIASVVAHGLEYRGVERYSKDFAVDYASARALVHGDDPYAPIQTLILQQLGAPPEVVSEHVFPGGNWHPPLKIVTTAPLTALPYRAAGVVWLLLSAATMVWAIGLFGSEIGWSRSASIVCGLAVLALPITQKDLSAAQINGPLLLLAVAGWRFLRRDSDLAAGMCLGLAAGLKAFPAVFLLAVLGMRRIKPVVVAVATAAGLNLLAFVWVGVSRLSEIRSIGSEGLRYWDASPANVSWYGVPTRWLTDNGWVPHLSLPALGAILAVGGCLLFALGCLRPGARLSGDAFWAAAPLGLLAWPLVWDHYLLLTLPWLVLASREVLRRGRGALLAGLGVVAVLLVLGIPPGASPLDRVSGAEAALVYQLPTAGLLGAALLDGVGAGSTRSGLRR